jgi:hypothetical protein
MENFIRGTTIWLNRLAQFDLFRKLNINDILNGKSFIPSVVIQLIRPTNENCKETQSARMYRFRKRQFGDNCD